MNEEEKNDFLNMISKEFTINDLFNDFGNGNYSTRPNVPGKWNPFEPKKKAPYQIYPPYQVGDIEQTDPYEDVKKDLDNDLFEALRRFAEEKERLDRQAVERQKTVEDEIQRLFGNTSSLKADEKKQVLKNAFIKMITDKINFDDNGNLIDEYGNIIKSIGQFGLMFMRLLNAVLESKKNAEQNEKDLKTLK